MTTIRHWLGLDSLVQREQRKRAIAAAEDAAKTAADRLDSELEALAKDLRKQGRQENDQRHRFR